MRINNKKFFSHHVFWLHDLGLYETLHIGYGKELFLLLAPPI